MKINLLKTTALFVFLSLSCMLFSQEYGAVLDESFENGIPQGWVQDKISGDIDWVVESGELSRPSNAYDGVKRVAFRNTKGITTKARTRLILPAVDISQLYQPILVFAHAQDKWTSDFDTLRVLYRTSIESDWVQLKVFDSYVRDWQIDTLPLMQASKTFQLAFEATDNLGRGVVIDNVIVRSSPDCYEPEVYVANISNDTVDVGWYGVWDAESFSLKISTKMLTDQELNDVNYKADMLDIVVSDVYEYTIKNLEMNTKYYCYVRSNCYDDKSIWVVDSFTTANLLELPYSEDFNLLATPGFPSYLNSWYFGSSEDVVTPYVNTGRTSYLEHYSKDASFALSFYATHYFENDFMGGIKTKPYIPGGSFAYAALPKLADDVDVADLYLSFNAVSYEFNSESDLSAIIVGVMTDPYDNMTFEAVDTVMLTDVRFFEEEIVSFENYKGNGKFIAFMSDFAVNNAFDLDNLVVDYRPDVLKINQFAIGLPSAKSIKLSFDLQYEQYEVVVSKTELDDSALSSAQDVIRKIISDNGVVDGLDAATEYRVYVRGIDGGVKGQWGNCRYVRTPGVVTELPCVVDNVETDIYNVRLGNATTTYKSMHKNVIMHANSTYHPIFTNAYKAIAPSDFVFLTELTNEIDCWSALVFPQLPKVEEMRISFYTCSPNAGYKGSFVVGLMSDANDISTFEPIDTLSVTSTKLNHYFYDLNGLGEENKFFAVYADLENVLGSNRFIVDKVRYSEIPSCPTASNVQVKLNLDEPSKVELSWDAEDVVAWKVRLSKTKYETDSMSGDVSAYDFVYNDTVTTNNVVFTGLEFPKVDYYYTIQAICDEMDGEWLAVGSFNTECYDKEPIPYLENFDNDNYVTGKNIAGFSVPCMITQQVVKDNKYYPYITTFQKKSGKNSLSMIRSSEVDYKSLYVALPKMSKSISELQMTFWMYNKDLRQSVSVGVMSDANDTLTFKEIAEVVAAAEKTWTKYTVTFEDYEGDAEHIAIKVNNKCLSTQEFYIDDICVEDFDACVRPKGVNVKNITDEYVEFEWAKSSFVSQWCVAVTKQKDNISSYLDNPTTAYQVAAKIDTVTTNPYQMVGLDANTTYYVYVKSMCGDDKYSEWSNPISFYTPKEVMTPAEFGVENFDIYGNGKGKYPSHYIVGNVMVTTSTPSTTQQNYIPYCYKGSSAPYKSSGECSLRFQSSSNYNGAYAITSRFDIDDISTLRMKLWASAGKDEYLSDKYAHALIVGVVTNPNNLATFVPVDTLNLSLGADYVVHFDNYRYDYNGDKGKYVMFLSEFSKDNYAFIDDVQFDIIPSCYTEFEFDSISHNSVVVNFTKGQAPYQLVCSPVLLRTADLNAQTPIEITSGNSVEIDTLAVATEYYFYARSKCDGKKWGDWTSVEFVRTECTDSIRLPFSDGFEQNIATMTTATPVCWVAEGDPFVIQNYHTGQRGVYFEAKSKVQPYLVTQAVAVEHLSNCYMEFYANSSKYGSEMNVIVGVVEDIANIAGSFVAVDTIALGWTEFTWCRTYFDNYQGEGKHIAFTTNYDLNNRQAGGFYLDDVVIGALPSCMAPESFSLEARTNVSLDVSFKHRGALVYEWRYGSVGFDVEKEAIATVQTTTTDIHIDNLIMNTEYDVYVRAICSETEATEWIYAGKFATLNDFVNSLPYYCDFDTEEESSKWIFVQDKQQNQWYIGSDRDFVVSESSKTNDKALYVSSDKGAHVVYSKSASHSWAYRSVYLDRGVYTISYKWNVVGHAESSYPFDYVNAFLLPVNYMFNAGSADIILSDGLIESIYADCGILSERIVNITNENNVSGMCVNGLFGADDWKTTTKEIIVAEAGIYNMLYYWTNTSNNEGFSAVIDDILIEENPCVAPYDLRLVGYDRELVHFDWKSHVDGVQYAFKLATTESSNPDLLSDEYVVFTDTLDSTSIEIKDLVANTTYYAYVKAVCNDFSSTDWSNCVEFTTPCAPYTINTTYSFEDGYYQEEFVISGFSVYNQIPNCFISENEHITTNDASYMTYYPRMVKNAQRNSNGTYSGTAQHAARTGDYALEFFREGVANADGYIVMPMFDTNLDNLTLNFWMRCVLHHPETGEFKPSTSSTSTNAYLSGIANNASKKITVGTMTDPSNPETFVALGVFEYPYDEDDIKSTTKISDDPTGNDFWVRCSLPLSNATGTFIAFKNEMYEDGLLYNKVYIDDIEVTDRVCIEPSSIVFDSIRTESVVVDCKVTYSDMYFIELATDNKFENILVDTLSSFPVKFDGLSADTEYFVRAKANCSEYENSDWSMFYSFKTLKRVVYDQTFSQLSYCPEDWKRSTTFVAEEQFNGVGSFDYISYDSKDGWISKEPLFEEGLFASTHISVPVKYSNKYTLFSPVLYLENPAETYHLMFDLALTKLDENTKIDAVELSDRNSRFMVIVSNDGGKTWRQENATIWGTRDDNYVFTNIPHTGTTYSIDLTKYAGDVVQVAFYVDAQNVVVPIELHLDNVHINTYRVEDEVATLCQTEDYEDNYFFVSSESLNLGENSFFKWFVYSETGKSDILRNLSVSVKPTVETNLEAQVCEGDVFTGYGFVDLSVPGVYKQKMEATNGCDSVVVLTLDMNPTIREVVYDTICQGTSLVWNGIERSRTGVYSDTLVSVVTKCDSIVTLILKVNDAIRRDEYVNICHGGTYDFAGQIISETGKYEKLFTTASGCDSLVTLYATVLPDYSNIVINAAIAEGEVYNDNGFIGLTKAGSYTLRMKSVDDCDSIVTLNLVVGNVTDYADAVICYGDTYQFGSRKITESGQYIEKFAEDSVVLLTAVVLPDFRQTIDTMICKGSGYLFFDQTITESGVYTKELRSVEGCDSSITLNLMVIGGDTTYVEKTITTEDLPYAYMDYLYYDLATQPGKYVDTIVVEVDGCKDIIIHTLIVELSDAIDYATNKDLVLVPNPVNANSVLFVEAEFTVEERRNMEVEVFNMVGQRVLVETSVSSSIAIEGLNEEGLYIVRIIAGNGKIYQGKVIVK